MASVEYLILWYLSVVGAWGINVDTKEPIIRGLPGQVADESQDFGYQAVMHMLTIPDAPNVQDFASQARVVVGAPKGNVSSLATGLVYECPITPGECELMTKNTGELAESMLEGDQSLGSVSGTEQKDGQLLGATMANSGNRFMVCAPLYTQIRGQALWYTGKCFHSDRSLKNFTSYVFCNTATESQSAESVLECPAGLSLAGAEMSEGFLFGVPLFKDGFGNVAVYRNGVFDEGEIGGNSIFLQQRGYQVAYGYITTTEREQYVTVEYGAEIVLGRVIVIDPSAPTTRALEIPGPILRIGPNVLPRTRVRGIAVGFGYAIATARINDEKYDSLLISAPFTSEGYRFEDVEIGTVYVYANNNGALTNDPSELVSNEASFGRFGAAIANMGDINKDGYEDIAVSAPYEGNGVVYIYHSMADGDGLNLESVQQIKGNDLNTGALENLVGFGTVLSSGVDVDGNNYNDLLVGSFESQKVVVLRTRPIVNVTSTLAIILRGDSNTLNLDDLQCGENACFDVEVCFTVEPTGVEGDAFQGQAVGMNYTLELEAGRAAVGPSRRSFFQSTDTAVLKQSVKVLNDNTSQCQNHTVHIHRALIDRESEFNVSLRAQGKISSVPQSDGNQTLSDLLERPVVIYSPNTELVSVETPRNCGNDKICNTQLSVEIVDVANANDSSRETDTITVLLRVNNTGEDSFRTNLISTFNRNVFNLSAVSLQNDLSLDCSDAPNEDNSTNVPVQCLVGNPMRSNTTILARVVFKRTENRDFMGSSFTLTFNVRGTGEEDDQNDNSASTTVNISRVADLQVSRIEVTPDTTLTIDNMVMRPDTLTSLSQLGPSVTFEVIISNQGPSPAPGARLRISWPLNISEPSDSYILYPTSLTVSPEGTCKMDYIDPARLSQSRQQRQTGPEGAAVQGDVTLECHNNINCVPITCTFGRISSKDVRTVTINSSVDVKYFQTQPDKNIRIPIEATVKLYDSSSRYGVFNPLNRDTTTRTVTALYTVSPPTVASTTLPLWIILVIVACIVIFILLLGLTIVLLYCLGFFRRKRYGQYTSKATAVLETVPDEEGDSSVPGKAEEQKAEESAEEKAKEADEKAAEAGDHNEPDLDAKSPSLTSLDITLETKTPETDV